MSKSRSVIIVGLGVIVLGAVFVLGIARISAVPKNDPSVGIVAATPTFVAALPTDLPSRLVGLGILGDSGSDEYRADDNRGADYSIPPLNWVELLVKQRGVNVGPWGTWGEPRRTGYKYNWARSGARTADLISTGQAIGLAKQITDGEVSHALVWIGGNDFTLWNDTYAQVYDGRVSGANLQSKIERMVADMTLAVDSLQKAGPVKIAIVTIPDRGFAPEAIAGFPDAAKRQRVTDAVKSFNADIRAMAQARQILVIDGNALADRLAKQVNAQGVLFIGGEPIKIFDKGRDPHYGRLDDGDGHPHSVTSGLLANLVFIEPFDMNFGLVIPPLSAEEILTNAGMRSGRLPTPSR